MRLLASYAMLVVPLVWLGLDLHEDEEITVYALFDLGRCDLSVSLAPEST